MLICGIWPQVVTQLFTNYCDMKIQIWGASGTCKFEHGDWELIVVTHLLLHKLMTNLCCAMFGHTWQCFGGETINS